ncbi:hypothetical protein D3C76_1610430 [compost metagenome]
MQECPLHIVDGIGWKGTHGQVESFLTDRQWVVPPATRQVEDIAGFQNEVHARLLRAGIALLEVFALLHVQR